MGKQKRMVSLGVMAAFIVFLTGVIGYAAINEKDCNGGPIRLAYDYIGYYALNYTGNTNQYDYWDDNGKSKIISKNYKDRTDIATNNNSTAVLSPTNSSSKIKKAYLVWETRSKAGLTEPVVLITPNGKMNGVVADMACKDTRTNYAGQKYSGLYCMATDITSVVSSGGGYGAYTVANIPVWEGADNGVSSGGESVASWQLIVIEESPNFPLRNISISISSQFFKDIDYKQTIDFSVASIPNKMVSAQLLNGWTDSYSDVIYDGRGYPDDYVYEVDGVYYRYKTPARGLYNNGVSFNSRDDGYSIVGNERYANGTTRVHLYNDKRKMDGNRYQTTVYHYKGHPGATAFLQGAAIDAFSYDVRFDGNGATSGSMSPMNCIYGRDYNLAKNQFKRENYAFTGWNTKPDGSGQDYSDEAYIENLTDSDDGITLYAQWEPIVYNITLDNQYAVETGTQNYYEWYGVGNFAEDELLLPISKIVLPKKPNFAFAGYYTGENGSGTQYVDAQGNILSTAKTFTQDTVLHAHWVPAVYKITLDNQGANSAGTAAYYEKFNVGNYTTAACTTKISNITKPTKSHYVFKGYYTGKNGDGQRIIDESGKIAETSTIFSADTILYAYWEPNTYTITLDNQGANGNLGTKAYYEKYGVANYITLKEPIGLAGGNLTKTFNYTGSPQTFIAPYTGTYMLEVVGGNAKSYYSSKPAGAGAIALGLVELNEGDVLHIYVGGNVTDDLYGGWNGGGATYRNYYENTGTAVYFYPGAGATDIRKNGISLNDRIIVAGGAGGGCGYHPENGLTIDEIRKDTLRFWNFYEGVNVLSHYEFTSSDGVMQAVLPNQTRSASLKVGQTINATDGSNNFFTVKWASNGTFGQGGYGSGGGWYGGSSYYGITKDPFSIYPPRNTYGNMGGTGGSSYIGGVYSGRVESGAGKGKTSYAKITYTNYAYESTSKEATSITVPEKGGYVFGGYYTGKNGTGTQYVDAAGNILSSATTFTSNTTLYAKWTASSSNTYQIAFNGNGADAGKMSMMTCTFNTNYSLSTNQFTKTGYSFAGWNTRSDGKGTSYGNGATVNNLTKTKGDVVTLHAQWKANIVPYKVNHYTHNMDGSWALHSTDNKTGTANSSVTVANFRKTINGFTFYQGEVKGDAVSTTTISPDGNLVINMYYTRNSYTVTLEKGVGISTVGGAGSYRWGERVRISASIQTGYTWDRWTGSYSSEDKTYEFTMPMANVSMTANTTARVYRITLDNQSPTVMGTKEYFEKYGVGNYKDERCTVGITEVTIPEKDGYTFGGYYAGRNGTGSQHIDATGKIIASSVTFAGDTTIYAYWIPNKYTVHFDGNGATGGSMSDVVHTYDNPSQLPPNAFTRNYYFFVGWNTEPDGSGMSYLEGSYVQNLISEPNGVITLYAQWTPAKVTVIFHRNTSVSDKEEAKQTFVYESKEVQTFTNKGWTRTGYTQIGWHEDRTATKEAYSIEWNVINEWIASKVPRCDLYAVWRPHTYTIKYDGNGAKGGSTNSSTHTYDSPKTLTPNGYTRPGYAFDGWNTKPDGSGTSYEDQESVLNLTAIDKGTVTLYAKWKNLNPVNVKLHAENSGKAYVVSDTSADITTDWFNTAFTLYGEAEDPGDYISKAVIHRVDSGRNDTIDTKIYNPAVPVLNKTNATFKPYIIEGTTSVILTVTDAEGPGVERPLSGSTSTKKMNLKIDTTAPKATVSASLGTYENPKNTNNTKTWEEWKIYNSMAYGAKVKFTVSDENESAAGGKGDVSGLNRIWLVIYDTDNPSNRKEVSVAEGLNGTLSYSYNNVIDVNTMFPNVMNLTYEVHATDMTGNEMPAVATTTERKPEIYAKVERLTVDNELEDPIQFKSGYRGQVHIYTTGWVDTIKFEWPECVVKSGEYDIAHGIPGMLYNANLIMNGMYQGMDLSNDAGTRLLQETILGSEITDDHNLSNKALILDTDNESTGFTRAYTFDFWIPEYIGLAENPYHIDMGVVNQTHTKITANKYILKSDQITVEPVTTTNSFMIRLGEGSIFDNFYSAIIN